MEEQNVLKTSFSFTDEFGQTSELTKTFTLDILQETQTFDLLVGEFKRFLLAAGFSQVHVDQVQIVE